MSFYSNYVPNRGNDTVIKMTSAGKAASVLQQQGYQEFSTLMDFYEEDPLNTHVGLVEEFGRQTGQPSLMPFYQDAIKAGAILETNGWDGKFQYDLPIETDNREKTVADTSNQEYAGIDNTEFDIVWNKQHAPGAVLTADGISDGGMAVVVSYSEPVTDTPGGGFLHRVKIASNDPTLVYPSELLKSDIEYFAIDQGVAEWGEQLEIVGAPGMANKMTLEFQVGAPKGFETYVTGKANEVDLTFGTTYSKDYLDAVERFAEKGMEVGVIQQTVQAPGGSKKIKSVATMMQMLMFQQFNNRMSTALMFGFGFLDNTQKGTVRYSEGLWKQMRRGEIITYPKRMGLQRMHVQKAADYAFKNNPMMEVVDRILRFKVGSELGNNFTELYREEAQLQLSNIALLLGADRILPKNPVSGDLYNLRLEPVRFTSIVLPGIGRVEANVDKNMDYIGMQDRRFKGANPGGKSSTTYSGIMWDVTNESYTNNQSLPSGVTQIGENKTANINLVVPKGDKIFWGTETGRYSAKTAKDIVSSRKTMTEGYFVYGSASVWMRDPSKIVIVELAKDAIRGYN